MGCKGDFFRLRCVRRHGNIPKYWRIYMYTVCYIFPAVVAVQYCMMEGRFTEVVEEAEQNRDPVTSYYGLRFHV